MYANQKERRKHLRLKTNGSLLIFNDKMYAEVLDVSVGGLACRSRVNPNKILSPVFNVEILDRESGGFLKGLSGAIIRCTEQILPDEKGRESVLNFGVEFKNLTEKKKQHLGDFIQSCLLKKNRVQPAS